MKIAVTGASGMLGRAVAARFRRHPGWTIHGLARRRAGANLVSLDLRDTPAVHACLDALRPEAIVHTAAIRDPDEFAADEAAAAALNVAATATLRDWAAARGAQMVYISSDYVFDGTAAPYTENSPTAPANAYGRSKLLGEQLVLANPAFAALRVPVLYSATVETLAESSVTKVAAAILERRANGGGKLVLDDWAVRYPTAVEELAEVLEQIVERRLAGLMQWSARQAMTKLDMGRAILEILGAQNEIALKGSGAPANGSQPRPKDCHLLRTRLEQNFGVKAEEWTFTRTMRAALAHCGALR